MKIPIKTIIILLVLAGIGVAGFIYIPDYWKKLHKPQFRTTKVSQGNIITVVNATGEIKPKSTVLVGSFVSGPIIKVQVDHNKKVKKGDDLARIDPLIYQTNVDRDKAQLANREAELKRIEALLKQAERDYQRAKDLKAEDERFISIAEMDSAKFNWMSLEAQLKVAQAAINQAEANLKKSEADLNYTYIKSPIDGVVIDRKVDEGQTVAASFQTPELFEIAADLSEMHIHASVDEADIGLINEARKQKYPVHFTVDAYPEKLFTAKGIYQIRQSPTTTQNVVTYPVIVETDNPDFKLKPGMTAYLSFRVKEVKDVLRIPNEALRFYPKKELVREEDRKLLEGTERVEEEEETKLSAEETTELRRKSHTRHVWVVDGDFLRAIEVKTGLSNHRYTEVISGDLKEGQDLVTGIKSKK